VIINFILNYFRLPELKKNINIAAAMKPVSGMSGENSRLHDNLPENKF